MPRSQARLSIKYQSTIKHAKAVSQYSEWSIRVYLPSQRALSASAVVHRPQTEVRAHGTGGRERESRTKRSRKKKNIQE